MKQVERDLREALKARNAPPDLAERILDRAHRSEPRWVRSNWLQVAALFILIIGAAVLLQQWQERSRLAQSEKAKEQLMAAMRITGAKIRDVKERIAETRSNAQPVSQE